MALGELVDLASITGSSRCPSRQIESLALRETCDMYHDEKGIGDSGEGLYEELCAHVRDAYEHEVPLMPGAREFLDELAAAGVPMVIASSTAGARAALRARGATGSSATSPTS